MPKDLTESNPQEQFEKIKNIFPIPRHATKTIDLTTAFLTYVHKLQSTQRNIFLYIHKVRKSPPAHSKSMQFNMFA